MGSLNNAAHALPSALPDVWSFVSMHLLIFVVVSGLFSLVLMCLWYAALRLLGFPRVEARAFVAAKFMPRASDRVHRQALEKKTVVGPQPDDDSDPPNDDA
ncbi:MAG: hypothetical protein PGN15_12755 [Aeromicrobium erythreum]